MRSMPAHTINLLILYSYLMNGFEFHHERMNLNSAKICRKIDNKRWRLSGSLVYIYTACPSAIDLTVTMGKKLC